MRCDTARIFRRTFRNYPQARIRLVVAAVVAIVLPRLRPRAQAPRFAMTQFATPTAVFKNPKPKLPMDATLLGPPDLKIPNQQSAEYGRPHAVHGEFVERDRRRKRHRKRRQAAALAAATAEGLAPENGGGTGGGAFRAGVNGVGSP